MITAYDIDTQQLISTIAEKLKTEIKQPEYVKYVKSGAHAERIPEQKHFWYLRCASILWQLYRREIIGVNRLRTHYGGGKKRGVKPNKHVKAGGATIRRAMVALEQQGYVKKTEKGRILTGKGKKLLDSTAKEIYDAQKKQYTSQETNTPNTNLQSETKTTT